jgi:mono/diheme cytochrome c family protein
LLEMSSILYSDYAQKQRLVKVPVGTQLERTSDGLIDFPNGTILVKTFFYYYDERDTSLGKRVIETRLLVREDSAWNVATYLWNEARDEATVEFNGHDTDVEWIDGKGTSRSTFYHVPTEDECFTCHQSNESMIPLRTKLRNLNHTVELDGQQVNQIEHLQSLGILGDFDLSLAPKIVGYEDASFSLADRGRAYLEMNCTHCHNPDGWDKANERDFDFRYEIPLDETGIIRGKDKIINAVASEEMPFIGTTLLHEEGMVLLIEYLESL